MGCSAGAVSAALFDARNVLPRVFGRSGTTVSSAFDAPLHHDEVHYSDGGAAEFVSPILREFVWSTRRKSGHWTGKGSSRPVAKLSQPWFQHVLIEREQPEHKYGRWHSADWDARPTKSW